MNSVDPRHYGGFDRAEGGEWRGRLQSCERDAIDLQAVAAAEGFAASALLSEAASVESVGPAISEAAAALGAGDMFVLTFSGYGGQVPDSNSEQHWRESTWALHDRQLPEDELASLLSSFRADVRVLVIDDSSSAGTVRRSALSFLDELPEGGSLTREIPPDVAQRTYRNNRQLYDDIQQSLPSRDIAVFPAAVLTIAGFREDQFAEEASRNGLFTETLLRVWDGGRFEGDYRSFVKEIASLMPPTQVPCMSESGASKTFVGERPFAIDAARS